LSSEPLLKSFTVRPAKQEGERVSILPIKTFGDEGKSKR